MKKLLVSPLTKVVRFYLEHQLVACSSFSEIRKFHSCSMSKRKITSPNARLCRDFPICVIHLLLYLAPPPGAYAQRMRKLHGYTQKVHCYSVLYMYMYLHRKAWLLLLLVPSLLTLANLSLGSLDVITGSMLRRSPKVTSGMYRAQTT